jgi:molybdopterin/thiamine biosynthesis adenylyltransferase
MNEDLDAWLDSLGINTSPEPQQPSQNLIEDATRPAVEEVELQPEPVPISDLDFEEILSDNGLAAPIIEPEEIHDGSDDVGVEDDEEESDTENFERSELLDEAMSQFQEALEEHEDNSGEDRDLDAEEDADWEEVINSRQVVPVMEAEMQRIASDTPTTQEEATAYPQREPLLIPNSPTLLIDDTTSRFSGMEWFNEIQGKRIIFAGIGGIGSNCVFQLARMNPDALFMYDDDMVETANMSGQLYQRNDAGKFKVAAMQDMITRYTNSRNIYSIASRYDETCEATDIMMCGFDNMAARRTFYQSWFNCVISKPEEERKNCLFIDGRLSVDTLQIYCITGDDAYNQNKYVTECLFSDSEADETICSMKQTTYLACMIGSLMVNLFTNFCANLLEPIIPYDLPFFTEYDAQNMIFKTEN